MACISFLVAPLYSSLFQLTCVYIHFFKLLEQHFYFQNSWKVFILFIRVCWFFWFVFVVLFNNNSAPHCQLQHPYLKSSSHPPAMEEVHFKSCVHQNLHKGIYQNKVFCAFPPNFKLTKYGKVEVVRGLTCQVGISQPPL